MPGYDRNMDESLFSKPWETEECRLVVSVWSYNKGIKKLQISRENRNAEGEYRFAKLGRMTKEEVEGVLPLMQEAIKSMD